MHKRKVNKSTNKQTINYTKIVEECSSKAVSKKKTRRKENIAKLLLVTSAEQCIEVNLSIYMCT